MKKLSKMILLSFLLFGLIGTTFTNVEAATNSSYKPVTVKTVKYNGLNEVKYPQISGARNKTIEAKINKVLLQEGKNGFKSYEDHEKSEEEFKNEDPEHCAQWPLQCDYTSTTTYRAHYNNGSFLSVMFYTDVYGGGAHGNRLIKSYNFNLSTGNQVSIKDILNTDKKVKKTKNYIAKSIVKSKPHLKGINASHIDLNDAQFLYYDKGISVVFNEYSIGSYADGNIIVAVPKSVYK